MSRTADSITIVCYDITSDRLRRKIDKCMKDFGTRLQFSVFMCKLDADGVERCRINLQKVLDRFADEKTSDDSLVIFEGLKQRSIDCLLGEKLVAASQKFVIY